MLSPKLVTWVVAFNSKFNVLEHDDVQLVLEGVYVECSVLILEVCLECLSSVNNHVAAIRLTLLQARKFRLCVRTSISSKLAVSTGEQIHVCKVFIMPVCCYFRVGSIKTVCN